MYTIQPSTTGEWCQFLLLHPSCWVASVWEPEMPPAKLHHHTKRWDWFDNNFVDDMMPLTLHLWLINVHLPSRVSYLGSLSLAIFDTLEQKLLFIPEIKDFLRLRSKTDEGLRIGWDSHEQSEHWTGLEAVTRWKLVPNCHNSWHTQ